MQAEKHIVLYDGKCGLCARSVRFIRRRDKRKIFHYIALQSDEAERLQGSAKLQDFDLGTVIYLQDIRFYYRSEAAIRILIELGGLYRTGVVLLVIPQKIRDFFYKLIARNRHRWFKSNDSCSIEIDE